MAIALGTTIMDQLGALVVVMVEEAAVSVGVLAHHQVQELRQDLEARGVDKLSSTCDKLKLIRMYFYHQ